MLEIGWVYLHKKFIGWEWYQKPEMAHLFLYFIMMANYEPSQWQGQTIARGQLMTGRIRIQKDTGLTPQAIRTCIQRLKKTHEIIIESTNKFSIITIVKYEDYQNVAHLYTPYTPLLSPGYENGRSVPPSINEDGRSVPPTINQQNFDDDLQTETALFNKTQKSTHQSTHQSTHALPSLVSEKSTHQSTHKLTNNQPTTNQQLTTSNKASKANKANNYIAFEQAVFSQWNSLAQNYPILSTIQKITQSRRDKLKKRYEDKSFHDFESILVAITEQPFCLAENENKWKISFDWLIENDTNYIKVLERKYLNKIDFKRKNIKLQEVIANKI